MQRSTVSPERRAPTRSLIAPMNTENEATMVTAAAASEARREIAQLLESRTKTGTSVTTYIHALMPSAIPVAAEATAAANRNGARHERVDVRRYARARFG